MDFDTEELLLLSAAGGSLTAAGYLFVRSGILGDKIVIHDPEVPEGGRVIHRALAGKGWTSYGAYTGQQALGFIQRHNRISRLVLMGHGAPDWMFNSVDGITMRPPGPGGVTLAQFDRVLAPRLVAGAIIGLAGCSGARNYNEAAVGAQRGLWAFVNGGEMSFAARMRDDLSNDTLVPWATVRAHTDRGHVTSNPTGREFPIGKLYRGQPGKTMKPWYRGWEEFNDSFWGRPAERWILGT